MVDNPVHHGVLGEERDDLHRTSASGTGQGVDFIDLADHGRPSLGGNRPQLLVDDPERQVRKARLADLPPVGVGVEAAIAHHDLALVGDVRGHPGDELQIVHRLQIRAFLAIPITDLALRLQEG